MSDTNPQPNPIKPITPPVASQTIISSPSSDSTQLKKLKLKPLVIFAIILAILIPSLIILFQLKNNRISNNSSENLSPVKFITPSPLPSSESTPSATTTN